MGVLLVLGLAACSATPYEYQEPGEVPEGPGVFTGDEGAVGVTTGEQAGEPSQAGADTASAGQSAGATAPGDCACPEGAELEAYREFLRWKAEAVGTPEYREFQDWREWRRQRSGSD